MNGNSAYSNSNSFALGAPDDPQARTLPLWFRVVMAVPVTLVTGI